jgi:hypothetical protein
MYSQCSSVLRVENPTEGGLPTCERSAFFGVNPAVLLQCLEWHVTRRMYLCWVGRCSSVVEQVLRAVP